MFFGLVFMLRSWQNVHHYVTNSILCTCTWQNNLKLGYKFSHLSGLEVCVKISAVKESWKRVPKININILTLFPSSGCQFGTPCHIPFIWAWFPLWIWGCRGEWVKTIEQDYVATKPWDKYRLGTRIICQASTLFRIARIFYIREEKIVHGWR